MEEVPSYGKGFVEPKAGIVSAANYISRLSEYLKSQPNVVLYENTVVKDVRGDGKRVYISTEGESLKALKVVLACGRWISELVPDLKQLVTPREQILLYLEMKEPSEYRIGSFPSFAIHGEEGQYFGSPDIEGKELKVGTYCLHAETLEKLKEDTTKFVKSFFKDKVKKILRTETCYYTVTKEQDFIIDWADPGNDRILACSCCSGHAFKLSPIIGKIAADLLAEDRSFDLFEKNRHTFRIAHHQSVNLKP